MVMKKLLRNPLSMAGLIILLVFILVAVFAPWIAPVPDMYANNPNHDPYRVPRYGWGNTPSTVQGASHGPDPREV